jgi:hypothetical protein
LPFLDFFCDLLWILQVSAITHQGILQVSAITPELLNLSQICPWLPPLDPTVMASSPAARWGAGRQTSDGELKLSSPVVDWWRWFSRGGRRRAAAAAQGRCGRGSSDGGEGRGDAQQCAAPGASMWPREGARQVTGAEDRRRGESTVAVRRRPRELGLR